MGVFQPRSICFGAVMALGGHRCNISVSCRKKHSNNTVKCPLEIGPISKTEAGDR